MSHTPKRMADENLRHIAFIMDGNGRWAQKRGLPREFGHRQGAETFRTVSTYCRDIGIKAVTVYVLSTENLTKRPEREVNALMELLRKYLDEAKRDADKNKSWFRFPGDRSVLPEDIAVRMNEVESITSVYKDNHILNMCINYGGRADITAAVNSLIAQGKTSVTEADISGCLSTQCGIGDPDLIVRTGGDIRISNFLLWDNAYSELYFTPTLWPDMNEESVDEAVEEFYRRNRRFGAVR